MTAKGVVWETNQHSVRMCRRVTVFVLCVCVCVYVYVCYNSSVNIVRFYSPSKLRTAFLTRGFSIKPSVQKLWCEKANMLMSISLPRPHMALMQRNFTKTGPSLVLFFSKSNSQLQATWNSKVVSY